MPEIVLESLADEQRRETLSLDDFEALECLYSSVLTVKHPSGDVEEVVRLYAYRGLAAGVAGPRVYRELSPHATLKVLRGESCACRAHAKDPRAPRVCNGQPIRFRIPQPEETVQ